MHIRLKQAVLTGSAIVLSASCVMAQSASKDVTVVLSENVDVVEPCMSARQDVGRVIAQNVNETLVEFDYTSSALKPRLATEWKQVDANTWDFKLRPNVKWHDGSDFKPQDVAFTIKRNQKAELACETGGKYLGGMTFEFAYPDDHTIRIRTEPAQPILPLLMTRMMIESEAATPAGEFTRKPVGTGPYVFADWQPHQSITLTRNDHYWGDKPQVEKATYVFRSDSSVAAAMVTTGEADIVPSIPPQEATQANMDFAYPNSETTYLRIGLDQAPLNDRRIREALNLGFDREAMVGTVFPSDVQIATQLVVPTTIGYSPDAPVWPYDPKKAAALVAEAKADGVPVDKEIRIIGRTNLFPNSTEALEALQSMWQDIGLKIKLDIYDVSVWNNYFVSPFVADAGPTLVSAQHDNATGDPVFTAYVKYASGGAHSVLRDSDVDHLIAQATAATGDERAALWKDVFTKVNRDIITDVPMFHMVGFSRVSPRLEFKPTIAANSELQIAQIKFKQ